MTTDKNPRGVIVATDATGYKIANAYGYATQHTKPQGLIIFAPLPDLSAQRSGGG